VVQMRVMLVYVTMYLNDHSRSSFYKSLLVGMLGCGRRTINRWSAHLLVIAHDPVGDDGLLPRPALNWHTLDDLSSETTHGVSVICCTRAQTFTHTVKETVCDTVVRRVSQEYLKAAAADDLRPDLQQPFAEARQLHIAAPHILRIEDCM
jgi:hypothetical protein